MISEDDIHDAVDLLVTSAREIGEARGTMEAARYMLGHIEAVLIASSKKLDWDKRRAEARADPQYLEAVNEYGDAVAEFETLRAKREAASIRIQAWQTQSSNHRGIKL